MINNGFNLKPKNTSIFAMKVKKKKHLFSISPKAQSLLNVFRQIHPSLHHILSPPIPACYHLINTQMEHAWAFEPQHRVSKQSNPHHHQRHVWYTHRVHAPILLCVHPALHANDSEPITVWAAAGSGAPWQPRDRNGRLMQILMIHINYL